MFLLVKNYFPVKFMLGVTYVSSSREKLFPVKFMLGVPYVFPHEKLFPVKFPTVTSINASQLETLLLLVCVRS